MRRFILITLLMGLSLMTFSQTATYNDVKSNKKGSYTEYVTSDSIHYKIGDTLTICEPANNNYQYLYQYYVKTTFPLTTSSIGTNVIIKKMEIDNHSLIIYTTKPRKDVYGLCIINFDEARNKGEIK